MISVEAKESSVNVMFAENKQIIIVKIKWCQSAHFNANLDLKKLSKVKTIMIISI